MTRLFTIFLYLPSSNTIEIKSIISPLKVLLEVEEASRKQQRLELKVITVALTKMRFVDVFFFFIIGLKDQHGGAAGSLLIHSLNSRE